MKKIYKFNIILISIAILLFSIQINKNIVYGDTETEQGANFGASAIVEGLVKEIQLADESGKTKIQKEKTKQEETTKWKNVFSDADNFIKKGNSQDNGIDEGEIKIKLSRIFNVLIAIGTVIAVIVGGILGIKFMVASAEDKAHIKELMIPYVIGCIVIFGAVGIWSLLVKLFNNIS